MCYLNQQVTCILEIYVYIHMEGRGSLVDVEAIAVS